ncbi:hypothetical protein JDV02_003134 [Purpureocillium takamizusanense]|uniref:ubiquitinyl hydrolase 1 n=1 Tax=Purpureocillium takamizusanense TaxID=2060973 RepID=A0A9Q8QCH7_9HYPO|nr:uncharacterized protein JDV02_003134 [Purpureocillium takamizusanense]UNI16722.1 hypothetical protein JDV02_003134 [Purpureocillium takamizusanense]
MSSGVRFEVFELSPSNAAVYSGPGRLRRYFPEDAVTVPQDALNCIDFWNAMATTLARMSSEPVREMQARATKANAKQVEERDTVEPFIVKNLLVAILISLGGSQVSVSGFWKKTREEVMWSDGNKLPWRRSPVWLLLRVVLQQELSPAHAAGSHGLYKRYMVFLMSKIMEQCLDSDMHSDALAVMSTKIGRRLLKLDTQEEPWLLTVAAAVRRVNETLQQRWRDTIAQNEKVLDVPQFDLHRTISDLTSQIPPLDDYLESIMTRAPRVATTFVPPSPDICSLEKDALPHFSCFSEVQSDPYALHNIASFENWVGAHLSAWVADHGACSGAGVNIRDIIKEYHARALAAYQGRPDALSRMFLTILELWIACDKTSIMSCPLIADYEPEIPIEPFGSLLLKLASDMKRLFTAETYLSERKRRAIYNRSALFNHGKSDDFGVKFFSSSTCHQTLLRRIEKDARDARSAKRTEFQRLQAEYDRLMDDSRRLVCQYWTTTDEWGDEQVIHNWTCNKCDLETRAKALKIQAHEWPLPSERSLAQAVVFELRVPQSFGAWRDSTLFVLRTVLQFGSTDRTPDYVCQLKDYSELGHHFQPHSPTVKVELFSEAKPHAKTHRKEQFVRTANESNVCLDTGPRWMLLNSTTGGSLGRPISSRYISDVCTLRLDGPSQPLQCFLSRPWDAPDGTDPNRVVSAQNTCPPHLTTDEFKALASLPLGRFIVWLNVLTQLAMPSIDLSKVETLAFLWQVSEQCGPRSATWRRAIHERLEDTGFLRQCLANLTDSLERFKESWESRLGLATLTLLATRLLSLGCGSLSDRFLGFLVLSRVVSCGWQRTLRQKATISQDYKTRLDLFQRTREAALVCLLSFDVDDEHLVSLLNNPDTARFYWESLITLRETEFSFDKNSVAQFHLGFRCQHLIWRCHRLTQTAVILESTAIGFDLAIQASWNSFQRASECPWRTVNTVWVFTETVAAVEGCPSMLVHLNLVTGELLVDGSPRDRLPADYERHATYKELFGHAAFEAMPSPDPKMSFTASKLFQGFELHFRMDDKAKDLIVRATKDGRAWELILRRIFRAVLPSRFVEDFSHWYDPANSTILLRPHEYLWDEHKPCWTMLRSGSEWTVSDGTHVRLVFPDSSTSRDLADILQPLEESWGLNILFNEQSLILSVHIPRLNLDFFVAPESDKIQSRQYSGMHIDRNQGIETLVGLESKLVLCRAEGLLTSRLVLIPDGEPSMSLNKFAGIRSHPSVMIGYDSTSIQSYYLDQHLGALKGNGSLKSLLFISELHALTSGILPDPFTSTSGTAEALNILNSAAVRSLEIREAEAPLLERIARLSPSRHFYPKHARSMHVATWNKVMSPIAQAEAFAIICQELYDNATAMQCFQQVPVPKADLSRGHDDDLALRSCSRSVFVHGQARDAVSDPPDLDYEREPEESKNMKQRMWRAISFGSAMRLRGGVLPRKDCAITAIGFYETLKRPFEPTPGVEPLSTTEIQYRAGLLEPFSSYIWPLWCSLHNMLAKTPHGRGPTDLTCWLTTLAFARDADFSCLQALLAFASLPAMSHVEIPSKRSYSLAEGYNYNSAQIKDCIKESKHGFESSAEAISARRLNETNRQAINRRRNAYDARITREANEAEASIQPQWPCEVPDTAAINATSFRNRDATTAVTWRTQTWFHNLEFLQYLSRVCKVLYETDVIEVDVSAQSPDRAFLAPTAACHSVDIQKIVDRASPIPKSSDNALFGHEFRSSHAREMSHNSGIERLSRCLKLKATFRHELRYLDRLDESISCLQTYNTTMGQGDSCNNPDKLNLEDLLRVCRKRCADTLKQIRAALLLGTGSLAPLTHAHMSWQVAAQTPVWPDLSKRSLLALMGRQYWRAIPAGWREAIIALGTNICDLQAVERLLVAKNNMQDFNKELVGLEPRGWDPNDYPDSLLLEIEGNIRIRGIQGKIAAAMRKPPEDRSAVMQLNMGEGKSSVIVPIIAAALADGSRLVRVVVAKPQSRQMLDVLVSKLGGLMNRRIYRMPFSRSVKLDVPQVHSLIEMYQRCVSDGGVMVVQPEHALSFQLLTVETAIRGEEALAGHLWRLHKMLNLKARDIVDESDENFSTKFELIYTIGDQRTVEHGPERWLIIQRVLGIILSYSRQAKAESVQGVEFDEESRNSFPLTRFLSIEAGESILQQSVAAICKLGFQNFPIARQNENMRSWLQDYISDPDPSIETSKAVESEEFWAQFKNNILLLRGLFAGGILRFVFGQKRWRVNYGLDPARKPSTRLAVPYRAKDSPSLRSEFSHPDVVVCLTCLSYYYGGLGNEDLTISLDLLLRSDQADSEYKEWVTTSDNLRESFHHPKSINLRDREQCFKDVFPSFRHAKGAVDYFLSHFVFPVEMKEFPHKLSASGWDLAAPRQHPLTGFSGTNDSQHILPATVVQLELPSQKHTNALVLEHLLRPENAVVSLHKEGLRGICRGQALLQLIVKMIPEVRVVLDVGALVLDMTNEQFAREWLKSTYDRDDIEAVVFCSSDDDICVLDRRWQIELLAVSPFAGRLDRCVVFLDEAHTRGIDLRLPSDYRAAVSLGADLTKDRLIQACMRMRKLGVGQSVVFCVPEEIEIKIRNMAAGAKDGPITVGNVLEWAIQGTWADTSRSMPLWATQGRTFARNKVLWERIEFGDGGPLLHGNIAKAFLEDEAQSLEVRYRPNHTGFQHTSEDFDFPADQAILDQVVERCELYGEMELSSSRLREEQERELAPEIEQERQLERPAPATPAEHSVHADVREFVKTGLINEATRDDAFALAFDVLKKTSASAYLDLDLFPQTLLVTRDFERTVILTRTADVCIDSYLRPVQWILSNGQEYGEKTTFVILSPYEANELIPEIETSQAVILHLFSPRTNQALRPLDCLNLYTIPRAPFQPIPMRIRIELLLFSGQHYFASYEQYVRVCEFLCLAHEATSEDRLVQPDGFIEPAHHPQSRDVSGIFKQSPVKFLKALMTQVLRSGRGIDKTHLGRLLEGVLLTREDFTS